VIEIRSEFEVRSSDADVELASAPAWALGSSANWVSKESDRSGGSFHWSGRAATG
jgi:hypothetical protein